MALRNDSFLSAGTRKLLIVTLSVALLAVIFAIFHYRGINRSEDPRVIRARYLLAEYDSKAGGADSYLFFNLLDSAAAIYSSVEDYENSYEAGVIFNDKCSGLLLMAMYDSLMNDSARRALLNLSMDYCDSSIRIYEAWSKEWEDLSEEAVAQKLGTAMREDDAAFEGYDFRKIFRKRIKDIILAQVEIDRRLSVSLTNKGTAFRHLMMQDSAFQYFQKALSLWDHNHVAESNLSVLMGGEPVKPGLIESLFPPDRRKRTTGSNSNDD